MNVSYCWTTKLRSNKAKSCRQTEHEKNEHDLTGISRQSYIHLPPANIFHMYMLKNTTTFYFIIYLYLYM